MERPRRDGGYRIPQGAFLASLRGNYNLAAQLKELDERYHGLTEEQIRSAAAKSD